MFHTMPHKAAPVAIHAVAPAAPIQWEHAAHEYREAYALHFPLYVTRYAKASAQVCAAAKADVSATAKLHDMGAYFGKLMAELDAIRGREGKLRQGTATRLSRG